MTIQINKPNYPALLKSALTEPGKISSAYRSMHKFSVLNRIIAMEQMESRGIEISPLASFGAWRKKEFSVLKGQKAISLWMPLTIDEKDGSGNKTGETKTIFVMRANWFAMSQTSGWNNGEVEFPELPNWDIKTALNNLNVVLGNFNEVNGCSMGYSERGSENIAVSPLSPHPFKTLVHELAHQLLHKEGEGADYSTGAKEVEAESVAFIVTSTLDALDKAASDSSKAYIQSWGIEAGWTSSIPEKNAQRIFRVANQIIKAGEDS